MNALVLAAQTGLVARAEPGDPGLIGTLPSPPNVTPNFINPDTNNEGPLIAMAVTLPLAIIFVGLRLYTRWRVVFALGADDAFISVALAASISYCSMHVYSGVHAGAGHHVWEVTPTDFKQFLLIMWWGILVYIFTLWAIRTAILLLYLRLFNVKRNFARAVYVGIFLLGGNLVGSAAGIIFGCTPIRKAWDPSITTGKCIELVTYARTTGALNTIFDFMVLLLPVPMVWGLHLKWRYKLAVLAIFANGLLACGSGVARLVITEQTIRDTDATWSQNKSKPCIAEVNIGIMCACMPCLKPLVNNWLDRSGLGGSKASAPKHSGRSGSTSSRQASPRSGGGASAVGGAAVEKEHLELGDHPNAIQTVIDAEKSGGEKASEESLPSSKPASETGIMRTRQLHMEESKSASAV
ncbi:MAG: hypothetical protein M1832_000257 [Thelocarpon impressellum]|nr:MAG: hypothetical protein M1832_000257 [Thelocarpon impressellum]